MPSRMCLGFLMRIFSRCFMKSSSIHRWASPVETEPVNLLIELNVPAMIFFTRLAVPSASPMPASSGPWTSPSRGFPTKSYMPEETLLKKPIGLPMMLRLPRILKTSLSACSLYLETSLSVIPSIVSKQFCSFIPFKVSGASSMLMRATPSAVAMTVRGAKF